MEDAIEKIGAVEDGQWARRGAVIRAMSEKRRFFTVRLDLGEDVEEPTTDDDDSPVP